MSRLKFLFLTLSLLFIRPCFALPADTDYHAQARDEISWLWEKLKTVMNERELAKANVIQLKYLTSELDPTRIRATESGQIEFSFGAHVVVNEACTMSEYVRLMPAGGINKLHLLGGYNSYLAEARSFGAFFLDAKSYLAMADGKKDYSQLHKQVDDGIELPACRSSVLLFLMAHEFAHIQAGDPVKMKTLPADKINDLESDADLVAYDLMSRLRAFPAVGNIQFFGVFNKMMHEPAVTEYSSFDHPLPYDRMIAGANFAADFLNKSRGEINAQFPSIDVDKVIGAFKALGEQIGKDKKVQEKFESTSGENDGLLSFAVNDITYAIRVPHLYLVGGHGIEVDVAMARVLYERATKVIPATYYYQRAEANYGAGNAWSTGANPDFMRACTFIKRAHEMRYLPGRKRLVELVNVGKCKYD